MTVTRWLWAGLLALTVATPTVVGQTPDHDLPCPTWADPANQPDCADPAMLYWKSLQAYLKYLQHCGGQASAPPPSCPWNPGTCPFTPSTTNAPQCPQCCPTGAGERCPSSCDDNAGPWLPRFVDSTANACTCLWQRQSCAISQATQAVADAIAANDAHVTIGAIIGAAAEAGMTAAENDRKAVADTVSTQAAILRAMNEHRNFALQMALLGKAMQHERCLCPVSIDQVARLAPNISDRVMIRVIDATGSTFPRLQPEQIERLVRQGVSHQVIVHMMERSQSTCPCAGAMDCCATDAAVQVIKAIGSCCGKFFGCCDGSEACTGSCPFAAMTRELTPSGCGNWCIASFPGSPAFLFKLFKVKPDEAKPGCCGEDCKCKNCTCGKEAKVPGTFKVQISVKCEVNWQQSSGAQCSCGVGSCPQAFQNAIREAVQQAQVQNQNPAGMGCFPAPVPVPMMGHGPVHFPIAPWMMPGAEMMPPQVVVMPHPGMVPGMPMGAAGCGAPQAWTGSFVPPPPGPWLQFPPFGHVVEMFPPSPPCGHVPVAMQRMMPQADCPVNPGCPGSNCLPTSMVEACNPGVCQEANRDECKIVAKGDCIRITTSCIEARCQKMSFTGNQGCVVLEGDVRLVYRKGGQITRIDAPRVLVDLSQGSFTVEACKGPTEPVNTIPSVPCYR